MSPQDYLAGAGSSFYTPLPIYFDPARQKYVPVGVKSGDEFIAGCTCASKGFNCNQTHSTCRCEGNIEAGDGPCDYDRCKACKSDPRFCVVRPECECRRNATPGHLSVCNDSCHAQKLGCGQKVRVRQLDGSAPSSLTTLSTILVLRRTPSRSSHIRTWDSVRPLQSLPSLHCS